MHVRILLKKKIGEGKGEGQSVVQGAREPTPSASRPSRMQWPQSRTLQRTIRLSMHFMGKCQALCFRCA
eukprot:782188-Prorocentrum_lima.AAC.1